MGGDRAKVLQPKEKAFHTIPLAVQGCVVRASAFLVARDHRLDGVAGVAYFGTGGMAAARRFP
jgi:hypothetical protein